MVISNEKKKINLALQGGGAHGAYSWGTLDRLLEEDNFIIDGVSGTSAGAMNAAILVSGYNKGKNIGAKEALEKFWKKIGEVGAYSPLHKNPFDRFLTGWNMDLSPTYHFFDLLSRLFSPYDLNPFDYNPLRGVVEDMVDFDLVTSCKDIKLYIATTHVKSGQVRVFDNKEINIDVIMASACIPFLFKAVEIDGEEYWDGGYMGNPVIWPLIYNTSSDDVLLVQINPLFREETPRTAYEIIDRVNEINFNSSLSAEMRAIDFVSRLIRRGKLSADEYKDVRMHVIFPPEEMKKLNASSKMNADLDFFRYLHKIGYDAADDWLRKNWNDVGKKSTLNIRDTFLCGCTGNDKENITEKVHKKVDAGKVSSAEKKKAVRKAG
ncbi:MAG: patatin-like phospholipase family protein [Rickettsiales bacterium]